MVSMPPVVTSLLLSNDKIFSSAYGLWFHSSPTSSSTLLHFSLPPNPSYLLKSPPFFHSALTQYCFEPKSSYADILFFFFFGANGGLLKHGDGTHGQKVLPPYADILIGFLLYNYLKYSLLLLPYPLNKFGILENNFLLIVSTLIHSLIYSAHAVCSQLPRRCLHSNNQHPPHCQIWWTLLFLSHLTPLWDSTPYILLLFFEISSLWNTRLSYLHLKFRFKLYI